MLVVSNGQTDPIYTKAPVKSQWGNYVVEKVFLNRQRLKICNTFSTWPFLRRELQPLTVEDIRDHLVDLPVSSKRTSTANG